MVARAAKTTHKLPLPHSEVASAEAAHFTESLEFHYLYWNRALRVELRDSGCCRVATD